MYQGLGELYIVTSGKTIAGFFQSYRGHDFSTIFFIEGKRSQKDKTVFSIKTFYPDNRDTIAGTLKIISPEKLEVTLEEVPPGGEFSIHRTRDDFEKVSKKSWRGLGFITEDKVFLSASPGEGNAPKGYIVKNDCVALIDSLNGYSKVEYIGKDRHRIAWIPTSAIRFLPGAQSR